MTNNRRQFLKMFSSAMLAPVVLADLKAAEAKPKIPLAFSTLGCPAWDWKKILDFAAQHGFSAIELRGLEGNLDLPTHPVFAADRIEQTKREIRASKLRIANVSSSAQLYVEDPTKRAKELSDARRFIDLALDGDSAAPGQHILAIFPAAGRVFQVSVADPGA